MALDFLQAQHTGQHGHAENHAQPRQQAVFPRGQQIDVELFALGDGAVPVQCGLHPFPVGLARAGLRSEVGVGAFDVGFTFFGFGPARRRQLRQGTQGFLLHTRFSFHRGVHRHFHRRSGGSNGVGGVIVAVTVATVVRRTLPHLRPGLLQLRVQAQPRLVHHERQKPQRK